MAKIQAVLIAGPTASGKSRLAIDIARAFDGVIVNADSMQVYRDLRVLTARPSDAELAAAEHRLYGFVDGGDAYSSGRYAADAAETIADVQASGRLPVVVGGTGLYFRVLLEGLSPIPPIPDDVRAHWRAEGLRVGAEALHGVLAARDPVMAERLVPTDRQRIVRALEVLEATGQSLARWQEIPGTPVIDGEGCLRLVLEMDRTRLYERCDQRFDAMIAEGALGEVEALAMRRLDPNLPLMRAVGLPPLLAHVGGEVSLEDALSGGKTETRNYAKRQLTWLRRNMIAWNAVHISNYESERDKIFSFID